MPTTATTVVVLPTRKSIVCLPKTTTNGVRVTFSRFNLELRRTQRPCRTCRKSLSRTTLVELSLLARYLFPAKAEGTQNSPNSRTRFWPFSVLSGFRPVCVLKPFGGIPNCLDTEGSGGTEGAATEFQRPPFEGTFGTLGCVFCSRWPTAEGGPLGLSVFRLGRVLLISGWPRPPSIIPYITPTLNTVQWTTPTLNTVQSSPSWPGASKPQHDLSSSPFRSTNKRTATNW